MSAAYAPTRRSLLAAAAGTGLGLALAGCTSEPAVPPPPDPDDLLRASAVEREQSLIQAYDDALLASPALTARLLLLREQHTAHLEALRGAATGTGTATPTPATPTPTPTPTPTTTPAASGSAPLGNRPAGPTTGPPAVPGGLSPTDAVTLAGLVTAENAAAATHGQAAMSARERRLASLLAALSASEQSHPVALA